MPSSWCRAGAGDALEGAGGAVALAEAAAEGCAGVERLRTWQRDRRCETWEAQVIAGDPAVVCVQAAGVPGQQVPLLLGEKTLQLQSTAVDGGPGATGTGAGNRGGAGAVNGKAGDQRVGDVRGLDVE